MKYRKKPKNRLARIQVRLLLRRPVLKEKVAAIRTIAHNRSGEAKSECQCNRCFTAEKPVFSSKLINSGRSQNDIVAGDAKLSWILFGVNWVGSIEVFFFNGIPSREMNMGCSSSQCPGTNFAVLASILELKLSSLSNMKIVTEDNISPFSDMFLEWRIE